MITLLIIADDFTGALDTGVQFAAGGTVVRVVTDIRYDYRKADEGVRVLVMDAETRHLDSRDAYEVVWNITKRATCGLEKQLVIWKSSRGLQTGQLPVGWM